MVICDAPQHEGSQQHGAGWSSLEHLTLKGFFFLDEQSCGLVLRWKVLTSVPLLPSERQSIASQHLGLWAARERERWGWGVSSYNAEPGSHGLIN